MTNNLKSKHIEIIDLLHERIKNNKKLEVFWSSRIKKKEDSISFIVSLFNKELSGNVKIKIIAKNINDLAEKVENLDIFHDLDTFSEDAVINTLEPLEIENPI
ncbi:MAG: hypothetical protein ACOCQR_03725 [bacterium]